MTTYPPYLVHVVFEWPLFLYIGDREDGQFSTKVNGSLWDRKYSDAKFNSSSSEFQGNIFQRIYYFAYKIYKIKKHIFWGRKHSKMIKCDLKKIWSHFSEAKMKGYPSLFYQNLAKCTKAHFYNCFSLKVVLNSWIS